MAQFSPWPRTARRSSGLSFDLGTADNSCDGSFAANDMTSSARQGSLDAHLPWLDAQWTLECGNGAELWRRLEGQGFRGSLRVVTERTTRRRRS
jgi:hypothetical protein